LALAEASDLTYEQLVQKASKWPIAENVVVLIITVTPGATHNAADMK
jgi:exopolyphosphatase/guanosine-5'-triphosphate,3'-diphosphate pyrophosphatase